MAFIDLYRDAICRLARFRLKEDAETIKTVAVIDALLERASTITEGAVPNIRFETIPGHTVENYMGRALRYLSALERGEYPLKGMFAEPGTALVDHSFVEKDGRLHVFYNIDRIGYEWTERYVDSFGHAWTEDLRHWHIEPRCLSVEPGKYEDYQIWSPGITARDGQYYMYYTGVNYAVAQSLRLARSTDLYHWEKYTDQPVFLPGEWSGWRIDRWSDCRDPAPLIDGDGTAYLYYCTAVADGSERGRAAMGIACSKDLLHWEDCGFCELEGCTNALESPFVMHRDGRYYLFYTNVGRGTAYAIADAPLGPWKAMGMLIETDGRYPCPNHVPSCSEVFCFKGQWYISCAWRHPGCEQYLEIFSLHFAADGTPVVGERIG